MDDTDGSRVRSGGTGVSVGSRGFAAPAPWRDRFDRYGRIALLPMLGVSTVLAIVASPGGPASRGTVVIALTLIVGTAVWTVTVPFRARRFGARGDLVVFVVHLGLVAALVAVSSWFGLFAWTAYVVAEERLSRRGLAWGLAAAASVVAAAQIGGYQAAIALWPAYLVVLVVNLALALAFVLSLERMFRHNAELAAANEQLANALAENAGLHAQLVEQAREAGVLDERQRLAGEIHDTLAQGLAGIVTQLEAADVVSGDGRQQHLDRARRLARESLTEARRSVRALRPEQLEQASLDEALGGLVTGWSAASGVAAGVEVVGDARHLALGLDPEIEAALFRVAQEALTNVAKHARAQRVGVTLTHLSDVVLLDVRDDGVGGCVERTPGAEGGYGLLGMRARLARVGGSLQVESAPGEGTALSAAVPLPAPAPITAPATGLPSVTEAGLARRPLTTSDGERP